MRAFRRRRMTRAGSTSSTTAPCRWCSDTSCGCVAGTASRRGISRKTAGSPSSIGLRKVRPTRQRSGSCSRSRGPATWMHGGVSEDCNASCGSCGRLLATSETPEVSAAKVLDHLSVCSDEHRVVLMLAYVDGIPVAEIAELLGVIRLLHVRASRPGARRAPQPPHRRSDMTNHHDEMRVAPDPARGGGASTASPPRLAAAPGTEPVVPTQDDLVSMPSVDRTLTIEKETSSCWRPKTAPRGQPVAPRRRSPGQWLLVAAAAVVVAVVGTLLVAAGGDDKQDVDTVTPGPADDSTVDTAADQRNSGRGGSGHVGPARRVDGSSRRWPGQHGEHDGRVRGRGLELGGRRWRPSFGRELGSSLDRVRVRWLQR